MRANHSTVLPTTKPTTSFDEVCAKIKFQNHKKKSPQKTLAPFIKRESLVPSCTTSSRGTPPEITFIKQIHPVLLFNLKKRLK